jgi:hypothetical protein
MEELEAELSNDDSSKDREISFRKSKFFPDHPLNSTTRIEDHPMNKSGGFLEVLIYYGQKRKEIAEAVDRGEISPERAEELREDLKRPFKPIGDDTEPGEDQGPEGEKSNIPN